MTEINIIEKIQEQKVDFVNFWFVDIFGELHSVGIPSYSLTEEHFKNGLEKLDASSIIGFKSVNASDMVLLPDTSTFKILPPDYDDSKRKNARIFVNIYENSESGQASYNRDSRGIAVKAVKELEKFGMTRAEWGPELEFF